MLEIALASLVEGQKNAESHSTNHLSHPRFLIPALPSAVHFGMAIEHQLLVVRSVLFAGLHQVEGLTVLSHLTADLLMRNLSPSSLGVPKCKVLTFNFLACADANLRYRLSRIFSGKLQLQV